MILKKNQHLCIDYSSHSSGKLAHSSMTTGSYDMLHDLTWKCLCKTVLYSCSWNVLVSSLPKSSMNQRSPVSAGNTASLLQNKYPLLCKSHCTDIWICKETIQTGWFFKVLLQKQENIIGLDLSKWKIKDFPS